MTNITSWTDLAAISSALAEDYTLTADLASGDGDYSSAGGDDWTALSTFTGTFDGNGFTISDLIVDKVAVNDQGLFGIASGATFTDIGLIDADITGKQSVGSLVGNSVNCDFIGCYCTGAVLTTHYYLMGGLIGLVDTNSTVTSCYATDVTTTSTVDAPNIGGLIGTTVGTITKCYSTGSVGGGGSGNTGGLIGAINGGAVSNCYSTATVTSYAGERVGGLAGRLSGATLDNSYATGNVIGTAQYVGGCVGDIQSATATNCYATGDVTGVASGEDVGPFTGHDGTTGTNCWYSAEATILNTGSGDTNTGGTSTPNSSDFYDKTLNVYDTTATVWDFTTPIWYEYVSAYPLFIEEVIPARVSQTVMF